MNQNFYTEFHAFSHTLLRHIFFIENCIGYCNLFVLLDLFSILDSE